MNATALQTFLNAHGRPVGAADGIAGPHTYGALLGWLCGAEKPAIAEALAKHLGEIDTPLRVCHFLAQAAHETGGFKWLTEIGGPTYFAKYDGRRDLGNTQPGDGYRYRGRGIFQITGRANYSTYGAKIGMDLVGNPDIASLPDVAVQTAVAYWRDHGLNALADADDVLAITRKINGGTNGLADRQGYLAKLKTAWGLA